MTSAQVVETLIINQLINQSCHYLNSDFRLAYKSASIRLVYKITLLNFFNFFFSSAISDLFVGTELLKIKLTELFCEGLDKLLSDFVLTGIWNPLPADKADCTVTMKDADFVKIMSGRMNPQTVSLSRLMSYNLIMMSM